MGWFPLPTRRLAIAAAVALIASPVLELALHVAYSAWMGAWELAVLRPVPELVAATLAVWLLFNGPAWSRVAIGIFACLAGLTDIAAGVGIAWILMMVGAPVSSQPDGFTIGVLAIFLLIAIPEIAAGVVLLAHPGVREYFALRVEQRAIVQGSVSA